MNTLSSSLLRSRRLSSSLLRSRRLSAVSFPDGQRRLSSSLLRSRAVTPLNAMPVRDAVQVSACSQAGFGLAVLTFVGRTVSLVTGTATSPTVLGSLFALAGAAFALGHHSMTQAQSPFGRRLALASRRAAAVQFVLGAALLVAGDDWLPFS